MLRVKDVNDNSPMFKLNARPIIAAVPKTANYGYEIVKLQATDPDEGINGEVRYQIMGRLDDDSHKFSIDPVTGQVRSVVSFAKDVGKVYGFDVRAVDRRGADNGRSAISNVFVSDFCYHLSLSSCSGHIILIVDCSRVPTKSTPLAEEKKIFFKNHLVHLSEISESSIPRA